MTHRSPTFLLPFYTDSTSSRSDSSGFAGTMVVFAKITASSAKSRSVMVVFAKITASSAKSRSVTDLDFADRLVCESSALKSRFRRSATSRI